MPTISIIVPVYKVEPYIHRCVDSILSQTFTDFELILVDDGSPDNCGAICDEYAAKDSRVRVIHKENGGVSSARNAGLEMARGEYITFVDSDDWIVEKYLSELMVSEADIVCQTATTMDEEGQQIKRHHLGDEKTILDTNKVIRFLHSGTFNWTSCKRFKRNIIRDNRIRFEPSLAFAEDTLFTVTYAMQAHTIEVEDIANYRYVIYRSRRTLSDLRIEDSLSKHIQANQLIAKAIAKEDAAQSNKIFAERMIPHYSFYIDRTILSAKLSREEKVTKLKSWAEDSLFITVLENTDQWLAVPYLREAILKNRRLFYDFAFTYYKMKRVKNICRERIKL